LTALSLRGNAVAFERQLFDRLIGMIGLHISIYHISELIIQTKQQSKDGSQNRKTASITSIMVLTWYHLQLQLAPRRKPNR
jgi:hypothetical protein